LEKNYTVLVTGATEAQGNATARQLLARGFSVRAMTHKPHNPMAALLAAAGAEIVHGTLDDPALVYKALDGIKAVFAVVESRHAHILREEERGKRLAYLAKEQGVEQYVYSSVASGKGSGVPQFEVKGRIEQTIRELEFNSYTFLRGTFLMETLLDTTIFPEIVSGKIILPIHPDVRLQLISADDVAKYALYSFANPDLMNGVELDLAGDEHTFVEMAQVLSNALKCEIEYAPMDMDDYITLRDVPNNLRHNLKRVGEFWEMAGWDIDIGGLMLDSRKVGIDLKTLNEWANDIAPMFGSLMTQPARVKTPVSFS
jgi:uncharacterized protein YbjT (DUF2867 family)